jgi:hypothetical protein
MACQLANKKVKRRPNWVRAAADLGVTYSHLRRVLIGERTGKSLRKNFRDWQRQQRTANPKS